MRSKTLKDGQRVLGKPEFTTGKKDPFAEAFEAVQAKGHPLQDFDLVVQTFAEAVGFAVLPAVLDVAPPVADSAGGRVDLLYIGGGILFDPFCQLLILDRVGPGSKDIVEELKGIIGFQKIRSHFKGILEALLIFVKTSAPVFYLVIFSGFQEADDTF